MPGMTSEETDAFLAERRHIMRLGTIGTDGLPRVVPIWFMHDDGKLWFTPRARSAWLDDLKSNPGVCCTIDEIGGAVRKVVARGECIFEHELGDDDVWRGRYRDIALRYTSAEFADAYLADTVEEPRALISLDLAAAHVNTWRMPVEPGEDRLAVWAPKYYHRT